MNSNNLGRAVIQWCTNDLLIRGSPDEVRRFVQKAQGEDRLYRVRDGLQPLEPAHLDFSFHQLLPVPDELLDDLDAGYTWERIHWGVCWGPNSVRISERDFDMVRYRFDTRDGPPAALLDAVSKDFPSLVFTMTWGVPLRHLGGAGKWVDGVRQEFAQRSLDPDEVCDRCQEIKEDGRCPVCHPRPW